MALLVLHLDAVAGCETEENAVDLLRRRDGNTGDPRDQVPGSSPATAAGLPGTTSVTSTPSPNVMTPVGWMFATPVEVAAISIPSQPGATVLAEPLGPPEPLTYEAAAYETPARQTTIRAATSDARTMPSRRSRSMNERHRRRTARLNVAQSHRLNQSRCLDQSHLRRSRRA